MIFVWMPDNDRYCLVLIGMKYKLFSWKFYPSTFAFFILFSLNIRNIIHRKSNPNSVYPFVTKPIGRYVLFFFFKISLTMIDEGHCISWWKYIVIWKKANNMFIILNEKQKSVIISIKWCGFCIIIFSHYLFRANHLLFYTNKI